MITITLTYPDAATAALELSKLASKEGALLLSSDVPASVEELRIPAPQVKAQAAKAIEKAAKVEPPKPAPTPTASATATSTDSETTPKTEPATSAPAADFPSDAPLTYEVVGPAITKAAAKDKAQVVAALAKFGAKRGPDLKVEDYAAFMKEIA